MRTLFVAVVLLFSVGAHAEGVGAHSAALGAALGSVFNPAAASAPVDKDAKLNKAINKCMEERRDLSKSASSSVRAPSLSSSVGSLY